MIDDPIAIRALAHPLRHDLMSIIGRLGRATTADAARELGISHGLASHHLRQLAKYGFVEQVEGKDHREKPWRMVATSYNWSGAMATPEGSVAVDVLEQMTAERTLEDFLGWQQRGARNGRRNGRNTPVSANRLFISPRPNSPGSPRPSTPW